MGVIHNRFLLSVLGATVCCIALVLGFFATRPSKIEVRDFSSRVTVTLADRRRFEETLNEMRFWDKNALAVPGVGAKTSASRLILIVRDSLADPFYLQKDRNGHELISSNAVVDGNVVTVNVAIGNTLVDLKSEDLSSWVNHELVKILSQITLRSVEKQKEGFLLVERT